MRRYGLHWDGVPIQISVYEDKIVFWNSGKLPEEIPVSRLPKKHPSIPYNPQLHWQKE